MQKSRKIFDPADHEQPTRKQMRLLKSLSGGSGSPPPPPLLLGNGHHNNGFDGGPVDAAAGPPVLSSSAPRDLAPSQPLHLVRAAAVCQFCMGASGRASSGRQDILLTCKDCGTKGKKLNLNFSDHHKLPPTLVCRENPKFKF